MCSQEDLSSLNAAVIEQFPKLPTICGSYVEELANACHNIVKCIVQNPFMSDALFQYLIRKMAKDDEKVCSSFLENVQKCVGEKNLLEMLLNSECFKEMELDDDLQMPSLCKANLIFSKLKFIWQLLPDFQDNGFADKTKLSSTQKIRFDSICKVLNENLPDFEDETILYLMIEIANYFDDKTAHEIYEKCFLRYQQSIIADCKNFQLLATCSAKYCSFFRCYLIDLLNRLDFTETSDEKNELLLRFKTLFTCGGGQNSNIAKVLKELLKRRCQKYEDAQICSEILQIFK